MSDPEPYFSLASSDARDGHSPRRVPTERLHRLLLSLFASGEAFRQWVSLGPYGHALVAELPERPASTSAALFAGIEVLCRHGLVDHAFFARLARDFPFRTDDITPVRKIYSPSDCPQNPSSRRRIRRRLWVVAALGAAVPGGYLVREGLTTEMILERPGEPGFAGTEDREGPPRTLSAIPDASPVRASSDPPASPVARTGSPDRRPSGESHRRLARAASPRSADEQEAASPPRSGCVVSSPLKAELHALAHVNLSGPAITERFTVILRPHATQAEVSPRPSPGQASRERLYSRLLTLGPAELGDCRDVPVDVSFSWDRTAMIPRSP